MIKVFKGTRDTIAKSGTSITIKEKTYGNANITSFECASTQLKTYFNALLNSGFSLDFANWTSRATNTATTTVTIDSTVYNTAPKSFKVSLTATDSYSIYKNLCTFVNTHKYYIKAMGRNSNALLTAFGLRVYATNTVKQTYSFTLAGLNTWKSVSSIYTADGTETDLDLIFAIQSGESGTAYIDDIQLIDLTVQFGAGNEPTQAWCDTNITYDKCWAMDIPNTIYSSGDVVNLFDKTLATVGFYINSTNGNLIAYATAYYTNYIPVLPSLTYVFSGTEQPTNCPYAWYDKNKVYISGGQNVSSPISSPSNASYIRFTINSSAGLPSVNFKSSVGILNTWVHKKNLFDSTKITTGKYLSSTGALATDVAWYSSDFIAVQQNTNYKISTLAGSAYAHVCFYDTDKTFISGITNTTAQTAILTPANTKFIRFSSTIATISDDMLEQNTVSTTYEAYTGADYPITLPVGYVGGSLPNGVKDTETTKKIIKTVLVGGTEVWSNVGNSGNYIAFYITLPTLKPATSDNIKNNLYCDKFRNINTSEITAYNQEGIVLATSSSLAITILKSRLTTLDVAGFKTWLTANPVTLYCELATPVDVSNSIALPQVQTYADYTVVDTTNAVKSNLNLSYVQDFKFDTNGLGILRDTFNAKVIEALNGTYELNMSYPVKGFLAENLVSGNIIKLPCGHISGNEQLFRIKLVSRTLTTLELTAFHIFYDLADYFLEDVYPQNQTGVGALEWILSHTSELNTYTSLSDISNTDSARYVKKNVVEALIGNVDNSYAKVWGGELVRDNFLVKMLQSRGQDRGVKLLYGKNMREIQWDIDMSSITTRIYPQGYDGLELPEKYIDSPLINNYDHVYIKTLDCSDIKVDENVTQENAYQQLRDRVNEAYLNGADRPFMNISVDFIELSKVEEYKAKYSSLETIYLGDTVQALISDIGLNSTLKITKVIYDCLYERNESFEIGDVQIDYVEQQIQEKIELEKRSESVLQKAKDDATIQITSATGGNATKTRNEYLIIDTEDIATAEKVSRWNQNGFGYSSTGINGDYEIAITSDGKIVADAITTGTLNGELIKAGSINASSLTVGAKADLQSELKTSNNLVTINDNGINVTNATSETSTIIDNDEFAIYNNDIKVLTVNKDTTVLKKTIIEEDFTVGHVKQIVRTNGLDIVYVD